MIETGSISSWLALVLSVAVIIGGQIVLWVKFRAAVDGKLKSHDKQLGHHTDCIAILKQDGKRFLTMTQHDKIQSGCRAEIFEKIHNHETVISDIKKDIRDMREDVGDMKTMVTRLLTLQEKK